MKKTTNKDIRKENISEEDLTMLYYGEHTDPDLAARVAESDELSARFKALGDELELVEAYQPPERGADYGAAVWQRISPQLEDTSSQHARKLNHWWSRFSQPRFSLAGALSLALVATIAFNLGRNETESGPIVPDLALQAQLATIDSGKLLSSSVAAHLESLNVVLTEFVNTDKSAANQTDWAMDMLVANRLYRQSAANDGNRRLAAFLAGLEPLLIELAYEAQNTSETTRERMQAEVRDDLLFRIRVMNGQLKKPQTTT
jgi:hypothetical protein